MRIRLLLVFISCSVLFFNAIPLMAFAHLPRLVGEKTSVQIEKPEISKAYYGWLSGSPAVYFIASSTPFLLYVNLLSPQVDGGKMDYSAVIYRDGDLFAKINSTDCDWTVSYEPFANDYYVKGPEYEAKVPSGSYVIEVNNSGSSGNYVLTVGKTEELALAEFFKTAAILPKVKEQFFGKNFWEAFNNFIGLGLLIFLAAVGILFYIVFSIFKRWRLKRRLDVAYGERKNNR